MKCALQIKTLNTVLLCTHKLKAHQLKKEKSEIKKAKLYPMRIRSSKTLKFTWHFPSINPPMKRID